MGVTLEVALHDRGTHLQLEFACTVKHLEGLTALEIESNGADSALNPETKALAGLRVLLVSDDPAVCAEVEKACRALGLRSDTVSSSKEAVHSVERDPPHMTIVDDRLRDHEFDALMQDIRRLDLNFGFLEITGDTKAPEVSGWTGEGMARVRRDALRTHLPAMVTLELAKSF
jgi:CheY-like chemotaxis protein